MPDGNENYHSLSIDLIKFEQNVLLGKGRREHKAFTSLSKIEVITKENNSILLDYGDILVNTQKNLIKLKKVNDSDYISDLNYSTTNSFFRNWFDSNLYKNKIIDKDELITMVVKSHIKRSSHKHGNMIGSDVYDLLNNKNPKKIEDFTTNELIEAREKNINMWNHIRTKYKDKKFTEKVLIDKIRNAFVKQTIRDLNHRKNITLKKIDELSVIVENNDNPVKIIKDWVYSAQNKLMSAKEAKRKIARLQKEVDKYNSRLETLILVNLDKPSSKDRDEIQNIINNRKEDYNKEVNKILPNFHPKFHLGIRNLAENIDVIESEINIRLQSYMFSNTNYEQTNNEHDYKVKI